MISGDKLDLSLEFDDVPWGFSPVLIGPHRPQKQARELAVAMS